MDESKRKSLLGAVPTKLLCNILKFLEQPDLLKCRFISQSWNHMIKSHFIFNATLSDENLSRSWSSGVQLPWSRSTKLTPDDGTDFIINRVRILTVGELRRIFSGSLELVRKTVKEIEFSHPATQRNIRKIMKECWECDILRVHTSTFLGVDQKYGCKRKKPKLVTIAIDANQLRRVTIIIDNTTMNETSSCTVPFDLKINLRTPKALNKYQRCAIYFVPEGADEDSIEIFKNWVIDDEVVDIFSRPDCLRKLTYFATVAQAELRKIQISYEPHLSIPGSVTYTNVIHQPLFYPQFKKYPCGPFNGTILTYFSNDYKKQIMTYKPIHITQDVLFMSFPDAAVFILSSSSERKS